jgi:hypothetical protein
MFKEPNQLILPGNKDVLLIGSKLSVSERAVDDIKNNYIIYLSSLGSNIIKENKTKIRDLRKVDLKQEFNSEVFVVK